jgi:3-deoxy-D-manno-octulosonic-acid transferase
MLLSVYAAAATAAAPLLRQMLRRRVARGKEIATRLPERWGEDDSPRPPGRLLWLHAASIGETVSVLPVLTALHRMAPDVRVLLTTGTVTSAELLARRLPELELEGCVAHRFVPLDVPAWVRRFLAHWRPDAAALVESEIWPNVIRAAGARGIKLMLVNARLSPRSFGRWRRLRGAAGKLFGAFATIQAQSASDAERLLRLGARPASAQGNLKFSALPLPVPRIEWQRLRHAIGARPVWLAASTHPGEEPLVIAVHRALAARHPGMLTIIVPRHPERGAEVAALAGGLPATRRALGEGPPDGAGIWVADTLGELGLFYSAAGIVFVGGSLVPHGGQNPLEPARLGCAVAVGPHVKNFGEPVAILEAAGALARVADAAALAGWVEGLLHDAGQRRAMGEAGTAAARKHGDLPRQVADMLLDLLPDRQPI